MEQHVMLEARIAKLEHRLRLLVVGCILTLALGLVLALRAQTVFRARHIQVEKMEIVDKEGRPRIRLATFSDEDSDLGLRFYDDEGRKRAQLVLVAGDPYLEFYDPKGQTGARLSLAGTIPKLVLSDPGRQMSVRLSLGLGMSFLSFDDRAGRTRIELGLFGGDEPYFQILDSAERIRAALAVLSLGKDESAWLGLFDSAGKTLFVAP
jgi:hypothetical protein